MQPITDAYRPSTVHAQQRHAWRQLAAAGVALAEHAIKTDGAELLEPDHMRNALRTDREVRFPVEGATGSAAATAFVVLARGALTTSEGRGRVILCEALLAAARAVDELLTEQGHAEAARSRQVLGERPDTD
jgi:hypothetical protein